MEQFQKKLTKESLKKAADLDKYFAELAEELFKFYVIQKGDVQSYRSL